MTAPAVELQKAIFAELGGDAALLAALGGKRILAEAPPSVAFPYIGFGRTGVYDWSTGSEKDTEQLFTLAYLVEGQGRGRDGGNHGTGARRARRQGADARTAINRSISGSNSPRRATTKTLPFITACCASGRWRPPRRFERHMGCGAARLSAAAGSASFTGGGRQATRRRPRTSRAGGLEMLCSSFIPRSAGIG